MMIVRALVFPQLLYFPPPPQECHVKEHVGKKEFQCSMPNELYYNEKVVAIRNNNKIRGKSSTKRSSNRNSRRQLSKPEVSHTFTDTPT